ncbi:uncharacterized protein CTRU02_212095 [Colletotrichum truncatum]|uniref:Uncharacterized protein n=1 Tax=Colletotrichum truncatum TaxID=5467 RepID=A0ACC3YMS2_COLTU
MDSWDSDNSDNSPIGPSTAEDGHTVDQEEVSNVAGQGSSDNSISAFPSFNATYSGETPFADIVKRETTYPSAGVKTSKRDITQVEGRRYSQFLLHDIQNELSEGDTLIFVDFPAPSKPADNVDCFIYAWNSVQFRMDSEKLKATGSSKFQDMLNPSYQYRIQRRRKLVNKLPEGIKFVLDLTPPSEGDDLVFQMTEVSLTPGILNWWTAYSKHGIDDYVVSGHDDICSCWKDRKQSITDDINETLEAISKSEAERDENEPRDPVMERAIETAIAQSLRETMPHNNKPKERAYTASHGIAAQLLEKKSRGEFAPEPTPEFRQIPDYCPVRHRVNILRLMCIIAHKRVLIDSAPRVWTLVAVAKILDCASVVRDLVLQWLMSPNNTVFIEVLPEESLQLGVALRLEDVTRSAFQILVNELAIEEAAAPNGVPKAATYTAFGRKRHDPGDELTNLIQHAARAMVERVSRPVQKLTSDTIYDDLRVSEWTRLQNIINLLSSRPNDQTCRNARSKATSLTTALKNAWKTLVVSKTLNKLLDPDRLSRIDDNRATYVDIQRFHRFELIYNQFNDIQKALCPFLYETISYEWNSFATLFTRTSSTQFNFYRLANDLWSALEDVLAKNPEFRHDPAWEAALNLRPYQRIVPFDSSRHAFDPDAFQDDIRTFIYPFCEKCVRLDFPIQMNMTYHLLLTLTHNEFKFLPLWAGGNDDGTGGVFEPALPPADYGPAGPGPAYHTGITIPSDASSVAGSVSSELRQLRLDGGSTVGPGSVDVQDGISTIFNPNKVVADDVSVRSESFTDGGSDFANAKYAVLSDGQLIADSVNALVLDETTDQSDADTSLMLDNDDNTDDVMTEVGAEDSRSREETPEYVVTGSAAGSRSQPSARDSVQPTITTLGAAAISSVSSLDDDDLVMI